MTFRRGNRLIITRIRMSDDAHAWVGGQHTFKPRRGFGRSICHDDLTRVHLRPMALDVARDEPAHVVGRHVDADGLDAKLSFGGLAGISAGMRSGLEVNLLGLVAGVDVRHPAIKLPGFGRLGFAAAALAGE